MIGHWDSWSLEKWAKSIWICWIDPSCFRRVRSVISWCRLGVIWFPGGYHWWPERWFQRGGYTSASAGKNCPCFEQLPRMGNGHLWKWTCVESGICPLVISDRSLWKASIDGPYLIPMLNCQRGIPEIGWNLEFSIMGVIIKGTTSISWFGVHQVARRHSHIARHCDVVLCNICCHIYNITQNYVSLHM